MALNWNDAELADGLRCFNDEEFFAAHEHWESVWLKCEEPDKSFLQALIQVASAFHHHQNGNLRGTASLLNRARLKLDTLPSCSQQIDVAELRATLARWCRALELEEREALTPYPQIHFIHSPQQPQKAD